MSVQLGKWVDGKLFIEDLEYPLPKQPKKNQILNYDLPKKKQYWTRITEYEKYNWSDGWQDRLEENKDQLKYFVDEITRIINGVWVYINGEAVYLNGYTYFFLQWFLLEDGEYPSFRDSALYYYRFIEICDKENLCTGHTLLKARRLGATSMVLSALQLLLLTTKNSNFGIVSNKGNNASKAFQRAVKSMGNLPVFLRPMQEGNSAPKKVLSLKEQAKRITKDNNQGSAQGGLNNELSWENTDLNSYDSYALRCILLDEGGKYPKDCPVDKYLPVVSKCLKKGARVVGKMMMPTTCNPPSEGGAEYRVVWEGSNQSERDGLGQTRSGLYRIFIPSYIGFEGWITKYGQSIYNTPTPEEVELLKEVDCPNPEIGAKEYLEAVRKSKETNQEDLQEEIRMNPFTADEVFETANDRCIFNIVNLNERERELESELVSKGMNPNKDELGRRGWFKKSINGRVHFVDDKEGLWYVNNLLSESESNKFHINKLGKQVPDNEVFGAGGGDPVASGQPTVEAGSDACLMIVNRYSSLDPDNTGIPVAMFLGRIEDITKLNEQWFNGLIYYGVKMLAERAPDSWLTYARDNGLEEYIYGTKTSDGKEKKGIVAQHSVALKHEHAEAQVLASLHDHDKIPFIRIIRDRKNFNVNKRGDYDTAMALGYAHMALKIPLKQVKKKIAKENSFFNVGKVTTYN